jgi:hypothetical protein
MLSLNLLSSCDHIYTTKAAILSTLHSLRKLLQRIILHRYLMLIHSTTLILHCVLPLLAPQHGELFRTRFYIRAHTINWCKIASIKEMKRKKVNYNFRIKTFCQHYTSIFINISGERWMKMRVNFFFAMNASLVILTMVTEPSSNG